MLMTLQGSRTPVSGPIAMMCACSAGVKVRTKLTPALPSHFLLKAMKASTSKAAESSQGASPSPSSSCTTSSWLASAMRTAWCLPSATTTTSKLTGSLGAKSLFSRRRLYANRQSKFPSNEKDCTWPQPRSSTCAFECTNQPSMRPAPTQFETGYSTPEVTTPSSMAIRSAAPLPPPFGMAGIGMALYSPGVEVGRGAAVAGSGSATDLA
mmetsp:Transcript_83199/g.239153  ORF Transcript_83199/g.239153 Transcript_83199/m.239153 type:complete len:210 (+) Transcript_83199:1356-1985(+)